MVLDKINNLLSDGIEQGEFTHAAVALGNLENEKAEYVRVFEDKNRNIFDLASLTKALVTGYLMGFVLRSNNLKPSATVRDYCETLGITSRLNSLIKHQTIESILGHYSSFPAWGCLWINRLGVVDNLWEDRDKLIITNLNRIISERPALSPVYSDLGYILLGFLIERALKMDMSAAFDTFVAKNMTNFIGYLPIVSENTAFKCISTGYCQIRRKTLEGEVHDENCASLGGVSGHAGLFGTIEGVVELLNFYNRSVRFDYFGKNASLVGNSQSPDGLFGLRRNLEESTKDFYNSAAIGHLGFTGTSFYVEPNTKNYVVFLTNRVIKQRVSRKISDYRKQVHLLAGRYFNGI